MNVERLGMKFSVVTCFWVAEREAVCFSKHENQGTQKIKTKLLKTSNKGKLFPQPSRQHNTRKIAQNNPPLR